MSSSNGWRQGRDPMQRWLRVVAVMISLGMFVYLVIVKDGSDSLLIIALILGVILVLLGYESIIRLPLVGRRNEDKEDGRDGDK